MCTWGIYNIIIVLFITTTKKTAAATSAAAAAAATATKTTSVGTYRSLGWRLLSLTAMFLRLEDFLVKQFL